MTIVTILYPFIVNWVSKHQESKSLVEETRQLYENSFYLNNQDLEYQDNRGFIFQIEGTETEVVIYESQFEK